MGDSYISDQTDITYCDQRSVTIQRNGALSIKTAIIDIWKSNPEGNWRRYKTSPYTTNDKLLSSSPWSWQANQNQLLAKSKKGSGGAHKGSELHHCIRFLPKLLEEISPSKTMVLSIWNSHICARHSGRSNSNRTLKRNLDMSKRPRSWTWRSRKSLKHFHNVRSIIKIILSLAWFSPNGASKDLRRCRQGWTGDCA